jgi:hypothetical protein
MSTTKITTIDSTHNIKPESRSAMLKQTPTTNEQFLLITAKSVTITVLPRTFHKVIRVLNHWIEHFVTIYSDTVNNVTTQSP